MPARRSLMSAPVRVTGLPEPPAAVRLSGIDLAFGTSAHNGRTGSAATAAAAPRNWRLPMRGFQFEYASGWNVLMIVPQGTGGPLDSAAIVTAMEEASE